MARKGKLEDFGRFLYDLEARALVSRFRMIGRTPRFKDMRILNQSDKPCPRLMVARIQNWCILGRKLATDFQLS